MTVAHLIRTGVVVAAISAPPLIGVDWNVRVVDGTGVAMGTVGNPVVTTSTSSGGTVTQGTSPWVVGGNLTNNNAAPGATNVGVLPVLANAAAPTWVEGNQALLSANLAGSLRCIVAGTTVPGQATPLPVGVGMNGASGLLKHMTSALGSFPTAGDNALAVGPGVFDGSNWQSQRGNTSGVFVQGPVAAGAAAAGNPLAIGGRDASGNSQFIGGSNLGIFAQGAVASGAAIGTAGNPLVIAASDGSLVNQLIAANPSSDAAASSSGTLRVHAFNSVFNGTNFDRVRNNVDATLLASAARTTTQTSADITTFNAGAITCILDMTTVGTASVTLTINGKDPASGKYYLLLSGAAVTTNSTNVYVVDPTIPAVANVSAQKRLPRVIQIVCTANNANSGTYSIGYTLQPT